MSDHQIVPFMLSAVRATMNELTPAGIVIVIEMLPHSTKGDVSATPPMSALPGLTPRRSLELLAVPSQSSVVRTIADTRTRPDGGLGIVFPHTVGHCTVKV